MRPGLWSAAVVASLVPGGGAAAAEPQQEYSLKAQILLGLLPYVQWPAPAQPAAGPFVLGVFGRSPFGTALETHARSRTIQRRPIAIRYASTLEDLAGCEAVFICPSESRRTDQVVAWARGRRILTVADSDAAVHQGVMVVLLREGEFVRLLVNLDVAEGQGLSFGSLLLRNARILGREPGHP